MKTTKQIVPLILLIIFLQSLLILELAFSQEDNGWKEVFPNSLTCTYALKEDGTLWYFGSTKNNNFIKGFYDNDGQIRILSNPQQISTEIWEQVISGEIRLKGNGSLWYQGTNQFGILGDGTDDGWIGAFRQIGNDDDWKFVAFGGTCVYGIKNSGTLWAWGINYGNFGDESKEHSVNLSKPYPITQIGSDNDWKAIFPGSESDVIAIKNDGTIYAWGVDKEDLGLDIPYNSIQKTPRKIMEGTFLKLSRHPASRAFQKGGTAAVKSNGTLWVWGMYSLAWLFEESNKNQLYTKLPKQYGEDKDWSDVSVGQSHILAIKEDGTLWSAGKYNTYGEIGNGTKEQQKRLKQIGTDKDWVKIFAGYDTSFAIKKDGSLWSWGNNWNGQLGLYSEGINSNYLIPTKVE